MQYRRDYTEGAYYFFTVVSFKRLPLFSADDAIVSLRTVFKAEMMRHPFRIEAIVIMPDHIHAIWGLPDGDSDYSIRWRNIKRAFTAGIPEEKRPLVFGSRKRKKEQAIWQRRFWEHRLRDETDFNNHVDYIHYNPVKHGYVINPTDWQYSSIHRYIRDGIITPDWGCGQVVIPEGIGKE